MARMEFLILHEKRFKTPKSSDRRFVNPGGSNSGMTLTSGCGVPSESDNMRKLTMDNVSGGANKSRSDLRRVRFVRTQEYKEVLRRVYTNGT